MTRIKALLRSTIRYPGFVTMRAVSRFSWIRRRSVALQRATRARDYRAFLAEVRGPTMFNGVDAPRTAACIEQDGYCLGLRLPDAVVEEVRQFADRNPCWGERDPRLGFTPKALEDACRAAGRRFLLAHYFNVARRCPAVGALARDAFLLETAGRYLGARPRLVGVNLWWSFPTISDAAERNAAAQMFHYDLDDFRFIKFFFYVTPVDPGAGPHVIVRGSHRDKRFASWRERLQVRRYTDEEIVRRYGEESIVTITGAAGTGFAEDTLCMHKGLPPTGSPRLLLQVQYALNNFGNQHDEFDDRELAMLV